MRVYIIELLFILFILPFTSQAQKIDSLNILEFKNSRHPQKILILKPGKRITLRMKSSHEGGKNYSIRGKLTSITDTTLVIDSNYVVDLRSGLATDYRFNNHISGRVLLGTVGVGFTLFGTMMTALAYFTVPELAIGFGIVTAEGGAIFFTNAFSRTKHLAKNWTISVKKTKNQSK